MKWKWVQADIPPFAFWERIVEERGKVRVRCLSIGGALVWVKLVWGAMQKIPDSRKFSKIAGEKMLKRLDFTGI